MMMPIDPMDPQTPKVDAAASAQPKPTRYTPRDKVIKGNQYEVPTGWLSSPAILELLVSADWALTELAKLNGQTGERVDRVYVERFPGEKKIYISPTHATDPEGIEIKRYESNTYINLIYALWEDKLTLQPGARVRYDLEVIRTNSPVGRPCLCLDLEKPRQQSWEKTGKDNAPGEGA